MVSVQRPCNAGELINVPPGGQTEAFFVTKELKGESEQAFRVAFRLIGPPVDTTQSSAIQEPRVDCSMKIFPDLVLDPASIVIDLAGDGDRGAAKDTYYFLTITRVTRGKPTASTPPAFSMSPALLKAEPATPEKSAEEISPGLWRTIWKASVKSEEVP